MPNKKELPKNPSFELQRDLLIRPDSNPTGYTPFEDAAAHTFVPTATTWSRVNAWWLADASWIAYNHDAKAVRDVFRSRAGMESCQLIDGGGTQCYLAHRDSFAIVTFRGTQPDEWNDLFDIVRFGTKTWDAGRVHEGFADALDVIWGPLEKALNDLEDRHVWFTGHSLGGALAALAAFRRRDWVAGLYTFGCPRIGNGAFAALLDGAFMEKSIRYVNDHDAVTHMPPEPFAFPHGRYTHISHLRSINKDGQVGTTEPTVGHFALDVFGDTRFLLDIVNLVQQDVRITLPDTLVDHTPLYSRSTPGTISPSMVRSVRDGWHHGALRTLFQGDHLQDVLGQ